MDLEVVMLGCHLFELVPEEDVIWHLIGIYEGDLCLVFRVLQNLLRNLQDK